MKTDEIIGEDYKKQIGDKLRWVFFLKPKRNINAKIELNEIERYVCHSCKITFEFWKNSKETQKIK